MNLGVPASRLVVLDPSPDVQLLGRSVVLIQGIAALDAWRLMSEGIATVRRRDGIEPSPRLLKTVAALQAAAEAVRGPADVADIADVRELPSRATYDSGAGIGEVARMCGVGERQARRLAPSLGGRKTRKGWQFDRGTVQTYLDAQGHDR